jgi:hypothetical protein
MAAALAGWWSAIWPNLAANVIWVPAAALHHVLIRRHITREHEKTRNVGSGLR